ncbi:SDR family oxidoreductase [Escherichia coli]|nr:SDR family oxidoreductase [Escherichia coli]
MGMSAYGASKAALKSLALSVGLELAGSGVRCNVVFAWLHRHRYATHALWVSDDAEEQRRIHLALASSLNSAFRWVKSPVHKRSPTRFLFLASDLASHITLQGILWSMAAQRWGAKA